MDPESVRNNCKYFKNPDEYLGHIVVGYSTIKETANINEQVVLKIDNAEFKGSLNYKCVLNKSGRIRF